MEKLSFGQQLIATLGGPNFLKSFVKKPIDPKIFNTLPTQKTEEEAQTELTNYYMKKIKVVKLNEDGFQCKIPVNHKNKANAIQIRKTDKDDQVKINFFIATDTSDNFSSVLEKSYDVTLDQIKSCINYHTGLSFE